MTWHAKPSGSYSIGSTEGVDNILEMAACWPAWTDEAKSAAIGNSIHEGGLNPWRWQYDRESSIPDLGYGLFQFTPGSGYVLGVARSTPNLSTTHQTPEATPQDGATQCDVVATNELGKWVDTCWRRYWNDGGGNPKYPDLYSYRQECLNRWGNGTRITLAQFGQITDIDAATFVFLACFEGPSVPNYTPRTASARQVYEIITGVTPPPTPPDPPTPYPPDPPNVLFWMLKKAKLNKRLK